MKNNEFKISASLDNLFKSLPQEVADRLYKKYEEDRAEFLEYVKEKQLHIPSSSWVSATCKQCYGRGTTGTRIVGQERIPLSCSCISKNYSIWLADQRRQFNMEKGRR